MHSMGNYYTHLALLLFSWDSQSAESVLVALLITEKLAGDPVLDAVDIIYMY